MGEIVAPLIVVTETSRKVVGNAILNDRTYAVIRTQVFTTGLTNEEKAVLNVR